MTFEQFIANKEQVEAHWATFEREWREGLDWKKSMQGAGMSDQQLAVEKGWLEGDYLHSRHQEALEREKEIQ